MSGSGQRPLQLAGGAVLYFSRKGVEASGWRSDAGEVQRRVKVIVEEREGRSAGPRQFHSLLKNNKHTVNNQRPAPPTGHRVHYSLNLKKLHSADVLLNLILQVKT